MTLSVTAYHMFCCIQVSDTGPGIPEEEREKKIRGWNRAVRYSYHWAKEE